MIERKSYNIDNIHALTEIEAESLALEKLDIKGHTIYLVDFEGCFGYSCLVFKNGHHLYYANDYALHHNGKSRDELREWYMTRMENILFTQEELVSPLKDYSDYQRRCSYLRDHYGMLEDHISIFERGERDTSGMCFDRISFAYYSNSDFVREHVALAKQLETVKNDVQNNFEYQKSAFKYEMANHEYAINWQADFDTLSAFGDVQYHGDDPDELEQYFNELDFTDIQRKAYLSARREYLREANY